MLAPQQMERSLVVEGRGPGYRKALLAVLTPHGQEFLPKALAGNLKCGHMTQRVEPGVSFSRSSYHYHPRSWSTIPKSQLGAVSPRTCKREGPKPLSGTDGCTLVYRGPSERKKVRCWASESFCLYMRFANHCLESRTSAVHTCTHVVHM